MNGRQYFTSQPEYIWVEHYFMACLLLEKSKNGHTFLIRWLYVEMMILMLVLKIYLMVQVIVSERSFIQNDLQAFYLLSTRI